MTFFSWSTTASSNNTADSTINWREGQAPSTVNNSARGMMAAAAKYRDDISGKLNTGGSSTAYTITSNQSYTSLTDGIVIVARLHAANGASPTLNLDGLGAKAIRTHTSTVPSSGVMNIGGVYKFTYDSGDDCWYVNGFFTTTTTTFSDSAFRVQDNSDATKQLAFELSGLTTATTRTLTVADANGTIALAGNVLAIANNLSDVGSAATAFGNIKQAASDSATGVVEIAVQAEMEAASSTLLVVTPGRQHLHPSAAKAWVKWNGNTNTIDTDFGVASITDSATGDFTIVFDTAFSSANYAACGMSNANGTTNGTFMSAVTANVATTGIRVFIKNDDGNNLDGSFATLVALGDL